MLNYKLYEDKAVTIIIAFSCVMFCYNFYYWDYMSMYHQICDDAYISLKYAYNLYHYGELNYYPGYKVEGYTNFLWTVLISFAYVLNIEPVAYVKLLGFLSGIGLIFVVYLLAVSFFKNKLTASILALAIGINSQIAYMSSWGLETTFYIFLYTLASLCYVRNQLILSSLIIALSAMTRLEILAFFAFMLFFDYIKYKDIKRSFKLILPFSFLFVPYFYARYLYYGYLLPNTFYVKVGSGIAFIQRGIDYIYYNLHKLNILYPIIFSFFILLVGSLYHIKNKTLKKIFIINPLKATFIASGLFYSLYIIKVGGDVFGERFIIHYIIFYIFSILFLVDYIEKYRNINQYTFSILILFSLLLTAPSFPNSTHLTGYLLYGPYMKLSLGKYRIDFEIEANNIENDILANFDIFIGGEIIKEKLLTKSELDNNIMNISIPFEIDRNIENKPAEFRFYYFPNSDLTINFIHLNKI